MAPAGVYFAGAVYTFRDLTQVALGKRWALVAIFLGAAISLATSRQFALASLAAFLLGELLDMLIFSRLRQQGRILEAFAAGNTPGVALDSLVFLSAAFGSVALFSRPVRGQELDHPADVAAHRPLAQEHGPSPPRACLRLTRVPTVRRRFDDVAMSNGPTPA